MQRIAVGLAAAALSLAANAQSPLTTTFADNNSGSTGGAVYFDLTASQDLSITRFDLNLTATAGAQVGTTVFLRVGTYVGNESSPAGWLEVSSGQGVAAGRGLPSRIDLQSPVCLNAGTSYGIALVGVNTGNAYTNGDGTNENYSNNELALAAGSASNVPFSGSPFSPRVVNCDIYYRVGTCVQIFPPTLAGFAGINSGGALDTTAFRQFENGWFVEWDALDTAPNMGNMGKPFFCFLNFGVGGEPPLASYPQLPGFNQFVANGQSPGVAVFVTNPSAVGTGNLFSVQVPQGAFQPADTLRVQGLMLSPNAPGNIFRQLSASNSLVFEARNPITIEVKASGSNSFNSDTTAGFFSVENVAAPDIVSVEFDWVNSSNPGQSTMEFDTDQTGMADLFEGGNSTSAGCLGTYRNGSDVATGLVYDAANTVGATPCDPAANTGWIGSNPGNATDDYRTLEFRFASGTFLPGQKFEFDCDTDGGAGINGEAMDGMVVTITFNGGSQLTGELRAVPGTNESVLRF